MVKDKTGVYNFLAVRVSPTEPMDVVAFNQAEDLIRQEAENYVNSDDPAAGGGTIVYVYRRIAAVKVTRKTEWL